MTSAQRALKPLLRLPSDLHTSLIQSGKLLSSAHQSTALPYLDELTLSLPAHAAALRSHVANINHLTRLREKAISHTRPRSLHKLRLLLHGHSLSTHPNALPNSFYKVPNPPPTPMPPRGVYLHGDVGSGKTLLMDLLFSCASLPAERVHFHPFMTNVYERLHAYDKLPPKNRLEKGWLHPLDAVTNTLPVGLLCFDEFQIADVGDARLMHGIFERLFTKGTVVCFTANRKPEDINRSQMREGDFGPFLKLLYDHCDVIQVDGVDYRGVLAETDDTVDVYFAPGEEARVHQVWNDITGCQWEDVVSAEWHVAYGRKIFVQRVSGNKKGVQMSTKDLLEAPVGAADYRAICRNTNTIFLTDVLPSFREERNLVRRFITLVDVAYEEKVRLVMRMQTGLHDLFEEGDISRVDVSLAEGLQFEGELEKEGVGAENRGFGVGNVYSGEDERFAFRRAISRLREMGTAGFGGHMLWDLDAHTHH